LKTRLILTLGAFFMIFGSGSTGCTTAPDFDQYLSGIVKPYRFSTLAWEAKTLPHEAGQLIYGWRDRTRDEVQIVTDYFSTVKRIGILKAQIQAINHGTWQGDLASLEAELNALQPQKLASESTVERILERQIKRVLAEQGIFNPLDSYLKLRINFPPLNFKLEKPPHLLVVSPRDRIESMREVILKQDMSLEEMEAVESEVDKFEVSSLVVELGGLGATYPTFVTNEASLRFTLDAATEEWLHQYLFFRPLGLLYALDLMGLARNYEIATINETVASMASKEIGALVYQKYYQPDDGTNQPSEKDNPGFDFNQEMRDIRRQVDAYLAAGEIELAEEFMEQKRQYLASEGYYIRKLNQAYFAFHGKYADSPTSISPIGTELRKLRDQSTSLRDFLNKAAAITSRQQLLEMLK